MLKGNAMSQKIENISKILYILSPKVFSNCEPVYHYGIILSEIDSHLLTLNVLSLSANSSCSTEFPVQF